MRHDVFGIIVILMALATVNPATCAPYQFTYDVVGTNNERFPLPSGYFKSKLLETSPVESQHLDLYEKQDAEITSNYSRDSKITGDQVIYDKSNYLDDSYSDRVAKSVPNHQFVEDIFIVSQEYNIDPLLLHAIAEIESDFNPKAVSKAGARGLMQVMPDTARRFGMQNPNNELFNPISNLRISSNYLRSLHKLFGNNIPLILAAYNAGENAVIKYGYSIPPYKETKNYVKKVMKRYLELKDKSYRL
jgi:hypothetical protein